MRAKFKRSSKRGSKLVDIMKKTLMLTPTRSDAITPDMSSPSPSQHVIKEKKYSHSKTKNSTAEKASKQPSSKLPSKNQTDAKKKETNVQKNIKDLATLKHL